jgi:hypothetical protein
MVNNEKLAVSSVHLIGIDGWGVLSNLPRIANNGKIVV